MTTNENEHPICCMTIQITLGIDLLEMTTIENLDNQVNEIDCGIYLLGMTAIENNSKMVPATPLGIDLLEMTTTKNIIMTQYI